MLWTQTALHIFRIWELKSSFLLCILNWRFMADQVLSLLLMCTCLGIFEKQTVVIYNQMVQPLVLETVIRTSIFTNHHTTQTHMLTNYILRFLRYQNNKTVSCSWFHFTKKNYHSRNQPLSSPSTLPCITYM